MAEENLAIVRALFEQGRADSSEAMVAAAPQVIPALCTEDIVFVEAPERVDARTYHGHDGVRQALERWLEHWEDYRVELLELEDHEDQVLAIAREHVEGVGSGVPVESTLYVVLDFERGKISRYEATYDESRARAALER
jgi:ketosteroid isomerase-like protein